MCHRPRIDASDIRPHLAVVAVHLRPHRNLQWLVEVAFPDGSLQCLAATAALLQRLRFLSGHPQHLLRGLMEGGEPDAVAAVNEAAPQIHACGGLASSVATDAK